MSQTEMRECRDCHREKPLTSEFFVKAKGCYYGLSYRCKECKKELNRRGGVKKTASETRSREYIGALYVMTRRLMREEIEVESARDRRERWEHSRTTSSLDQARSS